MDATKNIQDKDERVRPQSVVTRSGMHNKQHVSWPPPAIPLPAHKLLRSPRLPLPYRKPRRHRLLKTALTSASARAAVHSATWDAETVPRMHRVPVAETWVAQHSVANYIPSSAWIFFCCYKTQKSLLRLPRPWARSKTPVSISTRASYLFLRSY